MICIKRDDASINLCQYCARDDTCTGLDLVRDGKNLLKV